MKRRLIIGLALAVMLAATMAAPAMADDYGEITASVTVTEVISVTITDANSDGVNFGTLDQGDTDKPDVAQSTTNSSVPAVVVTMGAENNVSCNVTMKGTDFDATIPIGSAEWAEGAYNAAKNSITTDYALIKSGVAAGEAVDIWHFIDIPLDAAGGTFHSIFTYKAVKQ